MVLWTIRSDHWKWDIILIHFNRVVMGNEWGLLCTTKMELWDYNLEYPYLPSIDWNLKMSLFQITCDHSGEDRNFSNYIGSTIDMENTMAHFVSHELHRDEIFTNYARHHIMFSSTGNVTVTSCSHFSSYFFHSYIPSRYLIQWYISIVSTIVTLSQ